MSSNAEDISATPAPSAAAPAVAGNNPNADLDLVKAGLEADLVPPNTLKVMPQS